MASLAGGSIFWLQRDSQLSSAICLNRLFHRASTRAPKMRAGPEWIQARVPPDCSVCRQPRVPVHSQRPRPVRTFSPDNHKAALRHCSMSFVLDREAVLLGVEAAIHSQASLAKLLRRRVNGIFLSDFEHGERPRLVPACLPARARRAGF